MRSNGGLGRTGPISPPKVAAPRQSAVNLPQTRRDTVEEAVLSELPLCTTRFETICCLCLVVLIASSGIGIGLWYVLAV